MDITRPDLRLLAVIVVVVLAITLAAPARAEALEPLALVGLATLAMVGIIIIVYLVVANVATSRGEIESRYVACVETDTEAPTCWTLPQGTALTSDVPQS
jgi:hypothetical protein